MPLDSSRRLLSGGRYTQLPPVPEDDHTPNDNYVTKLNGYNSLGKSCETFTNNGCHHAVSRLITANGHGTTLNGHSSTTNGFHPQVNGHSVSTSEHDTSTATESCPVPANGHGKFIEIDSNPSSNESNTGGLASIRKFQNGKFSPRSSSLVHTAGAVVPQATPHQSPLTHQSFPSNVLHTEVRLSQGKPSVRPVSQYRPSPIRPDRTKSPSSSISGGRIPISRPCTKNKNASPPPTIRPPVRPPRQKRGRGEAILRAVTSRGGRGHNRYENLVNVTSPTHHGRHSSSPSPPYTPPPRSPHPGILINSAIAKQGIKRLTR